jgi:hypothetical protein
MVNGVARLPEDIAFRTWRIDGLIDGFEAVNTGDKPASWRIDSNADDRTLVKVEAGGAAAQGGRIEVPVAGKVSGKVFWANPTKLKPRV